MHLDQLRNANTINGIYLYTILLRVLRHRGYFQPRVTGYTVVEAMSLGACGKSYESDYNDWPADNNTCTKQCCTLRCMTVMTSSCESSYDEIRADTW